LRFYWCIIGGENIKETQDNLPIVSKNAQRVIKLLSENKLMTIERISKDTKIPELEVKFIIIELMAKGLIGKKKVLIKVDN